MEFAEASDPLFRIARRTFSHVSRNNGRIDRINANAVCASSTAKILDFAPDSLGPKMTRFRPLAGGLANRINLVFPGLTLLGNPNSARAAPRVSDFSGQHPGKPRFSGFGNIEA